ncbi:uncharacterized protein LOC103706454 isoform X2 [Phoenix dactylifera]|uniref:Uncharacterized protein LOC103706454 isoform X2 n=1 Tax=Phoenix dactylifera TaxID=42345 RepID=A0A8B7BZX6_PHODC|nr:uncharacterized protein LOC103706454 isoform X2 [Phoenix dactylifera]
MAAVDDPEEWRRRALEEEAVLAAAQVLFSFQNAWLPDPPPSSEDDEGPSEVAPPPLRWGSVRKRSRQMTMEGIREGRREEAAAVKKKGKMRASPPSPLYYSGGSSASTSGGSGGDDGSSSPEKLAAAERPRPAEPHTVRGDGPHPTKALGSERPPLVLRAPAPKSIRWSGKKKTIPELQALEISLLEERGKLQKEVEARRKDHEALLAENRRLKLSFELQRTKDTTTVLPIQTKQHESSHHLPPLPVQDCRDFLFLPDLNEPLPENLD